MRLLLRLFGLMGMAFVLGCTATVGTQLVALGVAWSRDAFSSNKMVRYAGVIYGLDPLDLEPSKPKNEQRVEPGTREEFLEDRVQNTPRLTERAATTSQSTEELRGLTLTLKRNREKYAEARLQFEKMLKQLETETATRALQEVQTTIEVIQPKQAKNILSSMLSTPADDPADDVMKDVVKVIRSLPNDKLRKILAEFKTDEELQLLHRILVEIGDLDDRNTQLSRSTP
jgi:hypothetical protein